MVDPMGVVSVSAAIAAGNSLSGPVDLEAGALVGLFVPAGWTPAYITFQGSPLDGLTFGNVYSTSGAELTFVAGPGRFLAVDPAPLRGLRALKLRSGTSAAPVKQRAAVVLTLLTALL